MDFSKHLFFSHICLLFNVDSYLFHSLIIFDIYGYNFWNLYLCLSLIADWCLNGLMEYRQNL